MSLQKSTHFNELHFYPKYIWDCPVTEVTKVTRVDDITAVTVFISTTEVTIIIKVTVVTRVKKEVVLILAHSC